MAHVFSRHCRPPQGSKHTHTITRLSSQWGGHPGGPVVGALAWPFGVSRGWGRRSWTQEAQPPCPLVTCAGQKSEGTRAGVPSPGPNSSCLFSISVLCLKGGPSFSFICLLGSGGERRNSRGWRESRGRGGQGGREGSSVAVACLLPTLAPPSQELGLCLLQGLCTNLKAGHPSGATGSTCPRPTAQLACVF